MFCKYIILLHAIIKESGRDPVSKKRNSVGVFACAPHMYLNIWLSTILNKSISVDLTPCHISLLKSTPFMNNACLKCRPTSVLYFPRGTSSRIALTSANAPLALALLSRILNQILPLSCTLSPKYLMLSPWCIILPCTLRVGVIGA